MENDKNKRTNKEFIIGDEGKIKDYLNQKKMEEKTQTNQPKSPLDFSNSTKDTKSSPLDFNQKTKQFSKEGSTVNAPISPLLLKARYEALQDRDTNFVFLFGDPGSGKTAITSALCYHMSTDESGGDVSLNRKTENLEGRRLLRDFLEKTRRGQFMDRTREGNVFEIDLVFEPHHPKVPLNFTFLDMSGEDLKMIADGEGKDYGKFDNNIEEYLNCPNLRVLFILVIPVLESLRRHTDESDDDFMLRQQEHFVYQDYLARTFVDYVKAKKYHQNPDFLLLISKWDEYKGKHKGSNDIAAYVKEKLPIIYTKLTAAGDISYFSVGTVEGNTITEFSHERARKVKNWIYKKIHGFYPELSAKGSIWGKVKKIFGK